MQYWLFKSEPSAWSWDDQVKKGIEHWDGVRNYQANNNMKAMKIGDKGFFYHSVKEKTIVGVVKVVKEHYPDHTDKSGRFGMVDIKALFPVEKAKYQDDYPGLLSCKKNNYHTNHFGLVAYNWLGQPTIAPRSFYPLLLDP